MDLLSVACLNGADISDLMTATLGWKLGDETYLQRRRNGL